MKYAAEQQISFDYMFSMLKGVFLRLRSPTSAFVGMGQDAHVFRKASKKASARRFNGGMPQAAGTADNPSGVRSLLSLRTFALIFIGTVFLVIYINNLLTINSLSMENERLRERIGISKSINAALELQLQEIHAVHNITARAEGMGLKARIEPAVIIRTD